MKKQNGITLIALTVTIVVMMILTGIAVNYGIDLISKSKLQDLRTNMLLIQAKAKEYVEEANFQKLNLQQAEEKGILKGENADSWSNEINSAVDGKIGEDRTGYYYLNEELLEQMGLKDLDDSYGYFIVKYDITNISAEVINTMGYKNHYTLTDILNYE